MYRYCCALLAFCLALPLLADTKGAYLVKDINQNLAPYGSYPDHFLTVGSLTYFNVTDGSNVGPPLELWRTDGTEAGTFKLSKGGFNEVVWNGRLWFLDSLTSTFIWSTDGTIAGTQSLSLPSGVTARGLMAGTSHLYFYNGLRLWRTDGTAASTVQVSSIDFGSQAITSGVALGQSLLFVTAYPNANSSLLWKTDDSGTSIIGDPGSNGYFMSPVAVGSLVYLQKISSSGAYSELWRSDGTVAGTFALKPLGFYIPTNLIVGGSLVTFAGNDGSGQKLWQTDGTVAGTVAVATTLPGIPGTYDATPMGRLNNGMILFTSAPYPYEVSPQHTGLWVFDGTTSTFLHNVDRGSSTSAIATVSGSYAFMSVGAALWRTDGSAAGTYSLGNLGDGGHLGMAALNGTILFAGYDAQHGDELWKTDGTLGNATLVKDILAKSYGSAPSMFRSLNGGTVFSASSDANSTPFSGTRDLWFSRGTDATTTLVLPRFGRPTSLVPCGGRAYFSHDSVNTGDAADLWSTDGTAAGTSMVSAGLYPTNLVCVDNLLFFFTPPWSPPGSGVWRSDGTGAGTLFLAPTAPYATSPLVGAGHFAWFLDSSHLWRSDGTPGGTVAIKLPGTVFTGGLIPSGNSVYFWTQPAGYATSSLWKSDGTQAGATSFLTGASFQSYADFYGKLVFAWNPLPYGSNGLCVTDGTSAMPTCFEPEVTSPLFMLPLNGRLYYNSFDFRSTDGVVSSPTGLGNMQQIVTNAAGRLYLLDGAFNLLETDGSLSGTLTIVTQAFDAGASGGHLYIGSDELYAYDLPVTPTSFAPMAVGTAGGQTVTITGRGFTSPVTVTVGGTLAVSSFISPATITFVTPPFTAGTYRVDLTLGDGRLMSLDDPLQYTCPLPSASISTGNVFVPASTPVMLHGSGGTRCAWFPAAGLDNPSSCTPTATVATSTTYTLVVFNDSGCSSTNDPSVRIHVVPPVPAGLAATAVTSTSVHLVWNASAGATQYDVARMTIGEPLHVVATVSTANYTDSSAAAGQVYVYSVRATGSDGSSAYGAPDIATTVAFTDAPPLKGYTPVRAVHIAELRTAVNVARALAALPAATWTDPTITPGVTPVRAVHFLELRGAIVGALNALGVPLPVFSTPPAQGGAILASHLQELRAALQ